MAEPGKYDEPKALLSDEALKAIARNKAIPLPDIGEISEKNIQEAWGVVSRLWPEMAQNVSAIVGYKTSKELAERGMQIGAAYFRITPEQDPSGEYAGAHIVLANPDRKLDPSALWHELVHLQQNVEQREIEGAKVSSTSGKTTLLKATESPNEQEAYQRQAQAKALIERFRPILAAEIARQKRDLAGTQSTLAKGEPPQDPLESPPGQAGGVAGHVGALFNPPVAPETLAGTGDAEAAREKATWDAQRSAKIDTTPPPVLAPTGFYGLPKIEPEEDFGVVLPSSEYSPRLGLSDSEDFGITLPANEYSPRHDNWGSGNAQHAGGMHHGPRGEFAGLSDALAGTQGDSDQPGKPSIWELLGNAFQNNLHSRVASQPLLGFPLGNDIADAVVGPRTDGERWREHRSKRGEGGFGGMLGSLFGGGESGGLSDVLAQEQEQGEKESNAELLAAINKLTEAVDRLATKLDKADEPVGINMKTGAFNPPKNGAVPNTSGGGSPDSTHAGTNRPTDPMYADTLVTIARSAAQTVMGR